MATFYVEDYAGDRNSDAVDRVVLAPVTEDVTAKVVEPEGKKPAAKKTSRAKTKG